MQTLLGGPMHNLQLTCGTSTIKIPDFRGIVGSSTFGQVEVRLAVYRRDDEGEFRFIGMED